MTRDMKTHKHVFLHIICKCTGAASCPSGGYGNDGALSRSPPGAEGHPGLHRTLRGGQRVHVQANGQGVKKKTGRKVPALLVGRDEW